MSFGAIIIHGLLPLAVSLAQSHSADSVPYSVFSRCLRCCSWTLRASPPLSVCTSPQWLKQQWVRRRAPLSLGFTWSPSPPPLSELARHSEVFQREKDADGNRDQEKRCSFRDLGGAEKGNPWKCKAKNFFLKVEAGKLPSRG